jgi:PAS domain S-box-containing protein
VSIDRLALAKRAPFELPDLARIAIVAAVYFGVGKLGLTLTFDNSSVTAVWPPSGVALAAVLLWGYRVWPGIALGALLANATTQGSALTVCAIAAGNTLEPVVGAYLLRRVGFRRSLERMRDVVALVVLAGALSTTISATIGVSSLAADGLVHHGMFLANWREWWLGDFGGDVLIGSTILVLFSNPRPPSYRLWPAEAVGLTVALVVVSIVIFTSKDLRSYVALPILFWAALRFGQAGAVIGGLLLSVFAVWFTKHGQGPFVGGTLDSGLLRAQTYVGITTITALFVAAVRSEQRSSVEAEGELRGALEALRQAEDRFRGAFENTAIGMAIVAPDGRWLRVNRALSVVTGYSEEELLGRKFQEITHPDDLDADLDLMRRMLAGKIRDYQLDKRYLHRDGHVVWITLSVSLVHGASGEPLYFVSQIEDVTERKRTQLALEATVEIARAVGAETELDRVLEAIAGRSRALVDASSLVILLRDGKEFIVAATAGAVDEDLRDSRINGSSIAGRVSVTGKVERIERLEDTPTFALRALGVEAKSALVVPFGFGGTRFGVIEALDRIGGPRFDDEDERLLQAAAASAGIAVATAQSVGRDRLRRTLRAAEDERSRWARELHDETLQALGALRVLLSSAYRSPDERLLRQAAQSSLEQLDTEIESLRVLISELRPAALDELGLQAALRALSERMRVIHGIEVTMTIDGAPGIQGPGELDPELQIVIYRVVQEALTNAARHARPESVDVNLSRVNGQLTVSVTDDGGGFDPAAPANGFGLAGMRERVSLVGGQFELLSSDDGTTVRVTLPADARIPAAG